MRSHLAGCIFLLLMIIAQLLDSSFQLTSQFTEAPPEIAHFPNLLDPELRKIRIQYELNSYHVDDDNLIHYQSALLDEAYSLERGAARVINYRNEESNDSAAKYDAFYWIRQNNLQCSIWLKPFICINSTLSIDDQPILCSAIRDFFPKPLAPLLVYTIDSGHRLFGLASILAHAHQDSRLQRLELINLWQLKLQNEVVFEFKMMDVATERVVSNMNLLIGFQVSVELKNKFRLQITILQADNEFSDNLLEWPVEYGCRLLPDKLENLNPKALETSPRTEYELEVSIITDGLSSKQSSIITVPPPYTPRDTMNNPIVHMVTLRLLYDSIDNMVAIDKEDALHVWRLDDKLMFHVDKNQDTCVGPLEIPQQDLKINDTTSGNLNQYCSSDLIGFNLSSYLHLKLTDEAVRLLRFSLPELNRLVRADLIQDEEYELTYLEHSNKLCLFLNDKLISDSMKTVRIFKRFIYNIKTRKLKAKTTSILYFTDSNCSKLMMQVDLNLISVGTFQPWTKARHFIDLSACSRGPKESVLLTIEYPMMENWSILEQVDKPNEVIRQAVAHYMHFTYNMSPLRIPQIDVHIERSLLKVQVRLLDRTSLYLDSSYLPVLNVISSSYQNWLRRATHSVLASDIKSCADYCQQYSCLVYVYCKTVQSCFVFKNANFGSSLGGSYESPEMSCEARYVKQERFNNPNVLWANKKSWSLEEIIEDIDESFEELEIESQSTFGKKRAKLSLDMIARWRHSQMLSRLIRLEPEYVHHQYELELDSDSLEEYASHSLKTDRIIRSNFILLLSGWTFGTKLESQTMNLHQPNLQISNGYWTDSEVPLSECIQLCLQDPKCLTLSYCSTITTQCILTELNATNIVSLLNEQEVSGNGRLNHIVVKQDDACALMKRTFFDQFEYFDEQQEAQLSVKEILDKLQVDSVEDCAASCMTNRVVGLGAMIRTSVCLSFSYCGSEETNQKAKCFLHERHLVSQLGFSSPVNSSVTTPPTSTDSKANMCQHYVRRFMADFIRQNRRKIPERFVSMKLSNFEEDELKRKSVISVDRRVVSLNHCAKSCEEDENCGAFDYCTSANTEAPDGLQLSCSLGSRETLELLPETVGQRKAHESANATLHVYLERSNSCAVYLYKSKSLVYNHKKRSLNVNDGNLLGVESSEEQTEQVAPISRLIYADMMIFGLFFFLTAMWSELRGGSPFSRIRLGLLATVRGDSQDQHMELFAQDRIAPLNAPGTHH